MDTKAVVRQTVAQFGNLAVDIDRLSDDSDLYQAGLTSHGTVTVMLAIEDAFGVEFPDTMLTNETFRSIATISERVIELQNPEP